MATTAATKELVVLTIAEYAAQNGFTQLAPKVRVNTNAYPFITFIDAKNVATNVYFSKSASKGVLPAQPVTKELLTQYQIGITHNEAGEPRVKLISNSERLDLSDLL